MAKIISIHSFRGGTGKSNTAANLAAIIARVGKRVAVIDTDILSPGIHILFGLDERMTERCLNDYLRGECAIGQAAYDVTRVLTEAREAPAFAGGALFLIPCSVKAGEITRVLREGYDVGMLNDGFWDLIDCLGLDYLVVDTHPGLSEETLLSIAVSDTLVVVLRPDQQDYQGTAITVDVAQKLDVPQMLLLVNKVLPALDFGALREHVESSYGVPVAAILPLSEEMIALQSRDIFALRYPHDPLTEQLVGVAAQLMT